MARDHRAYGRLVETPYGPTFARLCGDGAITVVVLTSLGGLSAEWWAIQDEIAHTARVLTYDRLGYGWSGPPSGPRTSARIVDETWSLLEALGLAGPYLLVGHSQGGLYAQHLARLHPTAVAGVVLLDPLSPDDVRFKRDLPAEVYRSSGADKTAGIRIAGRLARFKLLRLLKPMLLKAPPFYYYRDFPPETRAVIWDLMQRPSFYQTQLEEYALTHTDTVRCEVESAGPFPDVPLAVLYHAPEVIVGETVKYGGASEADAWKVERLWEELIRGYLSLSPRSDWIPCERASHFIHLDRPDLVLATIRRYVESAASVD